MATAQAKRIAETTIFTAKPKGAPDNMFLTPAELQQAERAAVEAEQRGEFATDQEVANCFQTLRDKCRQIDTA